MKKKLQQNYYFKKSDFQDFILDAIICDLWLLMKLGRLIRSIKKAIVPTCIVLLYTSLGLGFVLLFTIISINLQHSQTRELAISSLNMFGLTDESNPETSLIDKEIDKIQARAEYLESLIDRLNSQVASYLSKQSKEPELPDFASAAAGGSIISTPDTEPHTSNSYVTIYGIPLWKISNNSPRQIIKPWTQAGECWPFKGENGKIEIQLAYPTKLDYVTLEHIPVTASHTGSINSAPKNFKVYVYFKEKYIWLESFTYDINGNPSQRFNIKNKEINEMAVERVILEITSNWGNPEYTCIYRFRVHGTIFNKHNDEF